MGCEKFLSEYGKLLDKTLVKFRDFTVKDLAIYELCVASFASILTLIFYKNAKKISPILGIGAGLSYAYLLNKLFFNNKESCDVSEKNQEKK